jgi:hypothetical protein
LILYISHGLRIGHLQTILTDSRHYQTKATHIHLVGSVSLIHNNKP